MSLESTIRILAVDDRRANILALQALLEEMDVVLTAAASGEEAIRLASEGRFALILLDVHLSGISGLETARKLRQIEATKSAPIIFLTAFDRVQEQVEEAYALGAVDFLFKPIVAPVLIAKVQVFVDLARKTETMKRQQEMLREAEAVALERRFDEERSRWETKQLRREVEVQRERIASGRRHAAILRSIGDAVVAIDDAQQITLLNRAAEELCGWTEAEAKGRPVSKVLHLLNLETRERLLLHELDRDSLLISRNGKEHVVADSRAPILDEDDKEVGTVLAFRDVTTERQMEHAFHNHQRLESLGQLAAGIAHDFNNMLGIIQASASLLERNGEMSSAVAQVVSDIDSTCERASGLASQLLTFARGGAPHRELSDIRNVLEEAIRLSLRGSGTRAEFSFVPGLWLAEVDVAQMTQVFSNLGLNARDAMGGQGKLVVVAQNLRVETDEPHVPAGDFVEISVRDHGEGIERKHIDLIFDPYFSTKTGHNGIGLASAYSVVKRHGGSMRVSSVPGEGTCFWVYLPARPEAILPEPSSESETYGGKGRVLVMDDEPRLLALLADSLVALNCRVVCAKDGEEAIAHFKEARNADPFDVVILDLTIQGGMGGVATLKALKAIDEEVSAIACSGYADDPILCEHEKHGFALALRKPFRFAMLGRAVRGLLASRRPRERNGDVSGA